MTEMAPSIPPNHERDSARQDLWDRMHMLAMIIACDLRGDIQNDPWEKGEDYTEEQIKAWADKAEKASQELDSVLEATYQFMSQRRLPKA